MQYKCDKCSKEFNQKSHYTVHINRKFSCVPNIQTINELTNNILFIPHKTAQNPHKTAQIPEKPAQNHTKPIFLPTNNQPNINNTHNKTSDNNIINCNKCGIVFTRKDTLKRHLDRFCKANKKDVIITEVENKIELLNQELKQITQENKELKKLVKINPKCKNIITTNSNNIIQNQQNNTNNINIKMVNFGDEDIKKLTEDEILSILTSKSKVFINLIKAIHLNERLPEYNNLLINNLRSDYCSVIEDNKLVIKNKNKTLTELIEMRLSDLKDLINQYKTNKRLPKKDLEVLASVLEFLKTINLEDEDIDGNIIRPEKSTLKNIKELYKELTYIFYDNRDSIIKNINKVSEEEMIAYLDV